MYSFNSFLFNCKEVGETPDVTLCNADCSEMMSSKRFDFPPKNDLPINVKWIPFTRYSNFPTNVTTTQNGQVPIKQRNIIVGYNRHDGGWYEFVVDFDKRSITYKSIQYHYNKKFANLKYAGLTSALCIHSYLVQNSNYLVVFCGDKCYNVYDMENDTWLLNQREKGLTHNNKDTRSVLINDEIIIISRHKKLFFYFIGNNHITNPILIHRHTLKTKNIRFNSHGMCIISLKKTQMHSTDTTNVNCNRIKLDNNDNKDKDEYPTYNVKIMLFGGDENRGFLSSLLELDILISYMYESKDNSCNIGRVTIDEKLMNKNKIELENMDKISCEYWYRFGFECILNWKQEPIIIIVGGYQMEKSIHLYNCVTKQLICKDQVE